MNTEELLAPLLRRVSEVMALDEAQVLPASRFDEGLQHSNGGRWP